METCEEEQGYDNNFESKSLYQEVVMKKYIALTILIFIFVMVWMISTAISAEMIKLPQRRARGVWV
jgi:hypothetical protein